MLRPSSLIAAALVAACAALPAEGTGVALRIDRAVVTAPADAPSLQIDGALVNTGARPFSNGGCRRPNIVIDSLGAGVWVPLETSQYDDLIACLRAFTVDPGQTAAFSAGVTRPGHRPFPTGVRLRARVASDQSTGGPSAEFTLPR